jgi:hypothetical protein
VYLVKRVLYPVAAQNLACTRAAAVAAAGAQTAR